MENVTAAQERALRTARAMLDLGHPLELILENPLIPSEMRGFLRSELEREQTFVLVPARTLVADAARSDWVSSLDRSAWYYWPAYRQFLLTIKGWTAPALRSLDDTSDRILRQLDPPIKEFFCLPIQ